MITLYHCVSARSFRPLWTLEELRLPYELIMLPFPPRVHLREYLAINPLGTVPAFIDGSTSMTESSAICDYLAQHYDGGTLAVRPGEQAYGAYQNWLHFGEATLTFPQTLVLRYSRFESEDRRQPQVVEDYTRWFVARLRTITPILETTGYLCDGRFTVADISVSYALMLAEYLGLADQLPIPAIDYWKRMKARAGFISALEAQHRAAVVQGVPTTPSPLTE